jgi:peptide/nickel transport system ATP-binding protein
MDFKTLKLSGASDTNAWGPQFRDEGDEDMLLPLDLGGGHLVLARRSADVSELRH